MSTLSITPEVPTAQDDVEPVPKVASAREEGQAGTATPTVATVSQRTHVGEFHNLEVHWEGRVRLEVRGNAVHVALQSVRSPVQYSARRRPEVLFTIPEGFRPAVPIIWEVNGQHVGIDGQLDSSRSDLQVFRLHVDTEGHVRYMDDSGVDGVGYLRYHTSLAWPLAGTAPQVCERSWPIRRRILATLADLGEGVLSCDLVDWDQLARIQTWSSQEPPIIQYYYQRPAVWRWIQEPVSQTTASGRYRRQDHFLWPPLPYWQDKPLSREYVNAQPHDLLGLTNLTELHLQAPLHPGLLAHTPRLLALSMEGPYIPQDYLAHTPLLSHLHLRGFTDDRLLDGTKDALSKAPHLASLHLGLRHPTDNAFDLLQHVPQMTRLTIDGLVEPLPSDFLSALPNLTSLTVNGDFNPCTVPIWHLPTALTELNLQLVVEGSQVTCLANSWLMRTPVLTQLGVDLHGLENLDVDVLPSFPVLTRLTLDVAELTTLPPHLLANMPDLTHLHLYQGTRTDTINSSTLNLPGGLLANTPNLVELSLELPSRLHHVPAELLVPVPNLKRWRLNGLRLTTLSSGLLDSQALLTDVSIELCDLDRLPNDFLVYTPHLRSLYLGAYAYRCYGGQPGLRSLPERFLSHTPKLTHLWLGLRELETFPVSFLTDVPQLQHFELESSYGKHGKFTSALRSLPQHFLENAPHLTYLNLWPIVQLTALPTNFLAHSSRLQYLYLDANGVSTLPQRFLVQTPYLTSLELDLKQANALPDGFLSHTPELRYLRLDVDQVDVLPSDFLSHVPYLGHLDIRASNVVELPEGFLAYGPQIETLDLGMPRLASPPGPGDALWDTLQSTSFRVKVTRPDFQIFQDTEYECIKSDFKFELGDILEVVGREQDSDGNSLLIVYPWWKRDLFFTFYERHGCSWKIDARYTEPTLDM